MSSLGTAIGSVKLVSTEDRGLEGLVVDVQPVLEGQSQMRRSPLEIGLGWITLALLASFATSQPLLPHLDSYKGAVPDKGYLASLASNGDHLIDHCEERYRQTTLDHYSWVSIQVTIAFSQEYNPDFDHRGDKTHQGTHKRLDICCIRSETLESLRLQQTLEDCAF